MVELTLWRHPKPRLDSATCVGQMDIDVDPRKAKRLAHRVRAHARRTHAVCVVVTSPLRRAHAVGRWLRRWGWTHAVDARLVELDFGSWQGSRWSSIDADRMAPWMQDFAQYKPGGGESVIELLERCNAFLSDERVAAGASVVTHSGWLSAAQWIADHHDARPKEAFTWPRNLSYGSALVWRPGADPPAGKP
jgi:alpha-ribazole phosphatase